MPDQNTMPDRNHSEEQKAMQPSAPRDELSVIKEELKECKDKYLRLLAESENARKRMQKERQELTKYAVENVISEFLNPIDHFEKALKYAESTSDEVRNWALGFEMILGQFKQVLAQNGVVPYESFGKLFDPHFHEAVEVVETSDYPPGTVVQEFVRGYKMGDRAIRVARVQVAKAPESSKDEKELNNNPNQ